MEERKIFEDKKEFITQELENLKTKLASNLNNLPNNELPFMEPHLRVLYFETYFLIVYGFYNASLVLCGILLETFTKERLFNKGVKDKELERMTFKDAISKCKSMNILDKEELEFLESKKDKLRNPYIHYNKMKLSKGVYFPTWKVKNPVEKLIALDKRVKRGELTESQAKQELIKRIKPEPMSSREFRPISQIAKSQKDEKEAIPIFLEIDKFVRDFAKKYFNEKVK